MNDAALVHEWGLIILGVLSSAGMIIGVMNLKKQQHQGRQLDQLNEWARIQDVQGNA